MSVLKPSPGVLFQGLDGRWVWLCVVCGTLNVSAERPTQDGERKRQGQMIPYYPCLASHAKTKAT